LVMLAFFVAVVLPALLLLALALSDLAIIYPLSYHCIGYMR
jgi:hypothetical protein